jgi:hypothetical protein
MEQFYRHVDGSRFQWRWCWGKWFGVDVGRDLLWEDTQRIMTKGSKSQVQSPLLPFVRLAKLRTVSDLVNVSDMCVASNKLAVMPEFIHTSSCGRFCVICT